MMPDRTRRAFITAGTLATFGSVAGCLGSNNKADGSSLPFMQSSTDITYDIVDSENLSYWNNSTKVVRYSRSITTAPPVTQLNNADIKKVAKNLLYDVLDYGRKKANAVKITYLTEDMGPRSGPCATVEWAPNGDFNRASKVDTGEFTRLEFSVSKNPSMCQLTGETTSD